MKGLKINKENVANLFKLISLDKKPSKKEVDL